MTIMITASVLELLQQLWLPSLRPMLAVRTRTAVSELMQDRSAREPDAKVGRLKVTLATPLDADQTMERGMSILTSNASVLLAVA
ncbi:hypothetical protein AVEN_239656-1 [Araneus ventricosus]|uniref:Uncharacterized protein n=1 Tax=Araneus ventricosus TaxID=182803 RepID=A0A4Y2CTC9_ARAVE|nr:hypothetical protein AVEN_239656-1 [Araneus ventricosus]